MNSLASRKRTLTVIIITKQLRIEGKGMWIAELILLGMLIKVIIILWEIGAVLVMISMGSKAIIEIKIVTIAATITVWWTIYSCQLTLQPIPPSSVVLSPKTKAVTAATPLEIASPATTQEILSLEYPDPQTNKKWSMHHIRVILLIVLIVGYIFYNTEL